MKSSELSEYTALGCVPPEASAVERAGAVIRAGANAVCGLLFAAVFFVFCFKIISRYTGGDAAWADELTVILFIWILFLANGLIVREKQQITFDLIFKNLRGRVRTIVEVLRILLVLGILVVAAPGALDYIHFLSREHTSVMDWRLDAVYSCFGIYLVATIVRLALRLFTLLKPAFAKQLR
jgi:TRAP-type C4-dicarboxylate transport system permease small subunit